jgi:hypothetical protein
LGHPLAQRVLEGAKAAALPAAVVTFQLDKKITILEVLRGQAGWLTLRTVTLSALDDEEELIFAAVTDAGTPVDSEQCRRLFDLDATTGDEHVIRTLPKAALDASFAHTKQLVADEAGRRNGAWFEGEIDKLDRWADDLRATLKAELTEAEDALKAAKRAARTAQTLPEKLERQREVRTLEGKRDEAWRDYDRAGRELDAKKETLLDDISRRLEQCAEEREIFTIRWRIA